MAEKPTFVQTVPLPSGRKLKIRYFRSGWLRLEPDGGPYDLRSAYLSGKDTLVTLVPRTMGVPQRSASGAMEKEEMLEIMAWAKPTMSLPISLGNGRILKIKDYQNGQLKFELNAAPYVIYDCFLSGADSDHVFTLAPRAEQYPGGVTT
jgi:hypothetical protein